MSAGHEGFRDEAAAYLLGALEGDALADFERHAADCEECRRDIRWLTVAVVALPEAVDRHEPPPALRDRIMAEVEADAAAEVAAESAPARGRAPGWLERIGLGPLSWRPAVGLAVVVLLVAGFVGYEVGNDGGGGGTTTAPLTQIYRGGQSPSTTAAIVQRGNRATLRLANVKQLPEGRVLEAWVRRDGEIEPVRALFAPDHRGNAATTIADMRGVDQVLVTREPAGGTEAPTTTPIVKVNF